MLTWASSGKGLWIVLGKQRNEFDNILLNEVVCRGTMEWSMRCNYYFDANESQTRWIKNGENAVVITVVGFCVEDYQLTMWDPDTPLRLVVTEYEDDRNANIEFVADNTVVFRMECYQITLGGFKLVRCRPLNELKNYPR